MTQSTASNNTNTAQQQNNAFGTQQQSFTNPWAPATAELKQLLSGISGVPTGVTPAQTAAGNALTGAAGSLPNFGGAVGNVASGLLGGDPTGLLKSSNTTFQSQLAPIANAPLDPTQNPQVQAALQAASYNATQANNSIFAGSGRTGGGAQAYALGRGEENALAPIMLGQYNQDVQNRINAGSAMFGANMGTSNAITGNQQAGIGAAAAQPGIQTAPALAQLQAAMTNYNLPFSNLAGASSLLLPLAGLGGSSVGNNTGSGSASGTGTSNSLTTSTPSILSDLGQISGILGGTQGGLFGGSSPAFGNLATTAQGGLSALKTILGL